MSKRRLKQNPEYDELILKAPELATKRVFIGVPTTGQVRFEWASARYSQIIPCNWGHGEVSPMLPDAFRHPLGFLVAEARNIIISDFMKRGFEWLFFLDHDVCLPPTAFITINNWIINYGKTHPVICGLYFAKANPPEPLIYRGRGNGYFPDWKLGDVVPVDGIPMGCTLIHRSLIEVMYKDAPEYVIPGIGVVKRFFDTPFGVSFDPQTGAPCGYAGTEDLAWCNRVIAGKYLAKSGWTKLAKERYPFLLDTGLFCTHITNDGVKYPLFIPKRHAPTGKPARK